MDWKNKLYFGDNLGILREHVATENVDLIYLDPPFNSNATSGFFVAALYERRFLKKTKIRRSQTAATASGVRGSLGTVSVPWSFGCMNGKGPWQKGAAVAGAKPLSFCPKVS